MEAKSYFTLDKAALWPHGEWDNEPDKMQWADAGTGLSCLIVRHARSGHLCGYVGVPEGHPAFGKSYDDVNVDVHGGLTFANKCQSDADESRDVCHVPGAGEPDHVWWLGFDCAHLGDRSPLDLKYAQERGGAFALDPTERYRGAAYVQRQCASLAEQLARMAA